MKYRVIRQKNENKEKIALMKAKLKSYKKCLDLKKDYENKIQNKRSKLDMLRAGWSDTDPVSGGGCSQEDKIISIIDDIDEYKENTRLIEDDYEALERSLRNLPDEKMKELIYRLWIKKDTTVRGLALEEDVDKNIIWRKSENALLSLYKLMF